MRGKKKVKITLKKFNLKNFQYLIINIGDLKSNTVL